MSTSHVMRLCHQLQLTPFQTYVLEHNAHKYNIGRLAKRGGIVYAPYVTTGNRWAAGVARVLMGARADLIGPDKFLARGMRGVELYADGRYVVRCGGSRCYIDETGRQVCRAEFWDGVNKRRR